MEQLDHDDVMQMINENKEMVSMKIRYRDGLFVFSTKFQLNLLVDVSVTEDRTIWNGKIALFRVENYKHFAALRFSSKLYHRLTCCSCAIHD